MIRKRYSKTERLQAALVTSTPEILNKINWSFHGCTADGTVIPVDSSNSNSSSEMLDNTVILDDPPIM